MVLVEGFGNVFEKNQTKDNVFVFGCVHVVAQLVGGEPGLGFKAEVGGGVAGFRCCLLFGSHGRVRLREFVFSYTAVLKAVCGNLQ